MWYWGAERRLYRRYKETSQPYSSAPSTHLATGVSPAPSVACYDRQPDPLSDVSASSRIFEHPYRTWNLQSNSMRSCSWYIDDYSNLYFYCRIIRYICQCGFGLQYWQWLHVEKMSRWASSASHLRFVRRKPIGEVSVLDPLTNISKLICCQGVPIYRLTYAFTTLISPVYRTDHISFA